MKFATLILCCIFATSLSAQTKTDKIKQIVYATDFEAVGNVILQSYISAFNLNNDIPPAAADSIQAWVMNGQDAIKDSIVIIYDKLFTEADIDFILTFYNSKVGRKLVEMTPKITEMSARAGRNWGQANREQLVNAIRPIIEAEQYATSYTGLLDSSEVFVNLAPFEYKSPEKATSNIASTQFPYSIDFDAEDWRVIDCNSLNPLADVCLLSNDEKAYSMVIAEESHLSLHELKAAALSNMYAGAQDVQINDYGMIKVNGVDVLNMNIEAVIDKLNITYINNYISPAWGSIQVLSFCLSEDLESSKPLLNDINSGIQINK